MPFEKDEFAQWRDSEFYQDLKTDIQKTMQNGVYEILNRQDVNNARDMYVRGVLAGFQTVLDWKPDFNKPEEEAQDEET